jgi:hypothetical protein
LMVKRRTTAACAPTSGFFDASSIAIADCSLPGADCKS